MLAVAVFDTNVLISAALSLHGKPFRCLALAKFGSVQSVTCQELLDEFHEKLIDKLGFPPAKAQMAVAEVRQFSRIVAIANQLQAVPADPDDDKLLECAVVGGATHIVTGDQRHLLPLGNYQGFRSSRLLIFWPWRCRRERV